MTSENHTPPGNDSPCVHQPQFDKHCPWCTDGYRLTPKPERRDLHADYLFYEAQRRKDHENDPEDADACDSI